MQNIIHTPSPNFDNRPATDRVTTLVLHYTGMKTGEEALARLISPEAKVSAHYFIEEDGRVFQLVANDKRAWHAGISCWQGRALVNDVSIGVEIVNPGHEHGYRNFPEAQMASVLTLCQHLCSEYNIAPQNVVGHSDIAPRRKEDPGELFNWEWLAEHHVGLWHNNTKIKKPDSVIIAVEETSDTVKEIQQKLKQFGYHIIPDGFYGMRTSAVIIAFKRRFVQNDLSDSWTAYADACLNALIGQL